MEIGSIPTGQAVFHIALCGGKRVIPNAVYLIGSLRFEPRGNLRRRDVALRTGSQQQRQADKNPQSFSAIHRPTLRMSDVRYGRTFRFPTPDARHLLVAELAVFLHFDEVLKTDIYTENSRDLLGCVSNRG